MDCDKQKYICRFCLEIVPIGHSIFNEDIYKIVKNFTSLEVSCIFSKINMKYGRLSRYLIRIIYQRKRVPNVSSTFTS